MTDVTRDDFDLTSGDGHRMHARLFVPAIPAIGIIQILHGLGEHADRYERFAEAAGRRGFAVCVHDHRGHGPHADELGYFAASNGWHKLTEDALTVQQHVAMKFETLPIAMLGHSMGSYIAEHFAMNHGGRLAALLLSASNWPSRIELAAAHIVARIECWRLGDRKHSKLLDDLLFAGFNKPFEPARTELDWLSRDEAEVDKYIADPLCGGPYTAGLWRDLTGGLFGITSDHAVNRVPSDLPIMITGGEKDSVGGDKGMGKLAMHYAQTSHTRLKVKIYPEGRHEMLNETNRDEVTSDWLDWIAVAVGR